MADGINNLINKVLLKFYLLKSNFATLIFSMKMRLAIAPTSVAYTLSWMADYIAISVWGYCFIHAER